LDDHLRSLTSFDKAAVREATAGIRARHESLLLGLRAAVGDVTPRVSAAFKDVPASEVIAAMAAVRASVMADFDAQRERVDAALADIRASFAALQSRRPARPVRFVPVRRRVRGRHGRRSAQRAGNTRRARAPARPPDDPSELAGSAVGIAA
jgi:hypothetical protein